MLDYTIFIYETSSSKIIGVEGLIRWQHPSLGLVPPDKMIPIAEDSGQISMIDSWVIESACNEYKYLIEKHDAKFQLSLNLSQKNIPNDEIHRAIKKATEDNNFNLSRIDLEITETAMNTSDKEIIYVLNKLRKMNLHISVDDFGTGFATFTQLKNYLPVHSIKIDKSFVANIHKSKNDAMIVKSIIELARNLGVAVIAEGVEEKSQLNLLREFNCNAVQGFYLGKPMRVSELNSFLSRRH